MCGPSSSPGLALSFIRGVTDGARTLYTSREAVAGSAKTVADLQGQRSRRRTTYLARRAHGLAVCASQLGARFYNAQSVLLRCVSRFDKDARDELGEHVDVEALLAPVADPVVPLLDEAGRVGAAEAVGLVGAVEADVDKVGGGDLVVLDRLLDVAVGVLLTAGAAVCDDEGDVVATEELVGRLLVPRLVPQLDGDAETAGAELTQGRAEVTTGRVGLLERAVRRQLCARGCNRTRRTGAASRPSSSRACARRAGAWAATRRAGRP